MGSNDKAIGSQDLMKLSKDLERMYKNVCEMYWTMSTEGGYGPVIDTVFEIAQRLGRLNYLAFGSYQRLDFIERKNKEED